MSFDALRWAAKQRAPCSGAKLVLMGLANYANRQGLAFPSVAELEAFSELDRKSVIANLERLEGCGFIEDSGQRRGKTGQIKVWRLLLTTVPKSEPFEQSQNRNRSDSPRKSPKIGTRNQSEPSEAEASASDALDLGKRVFDQGVEVLKGAGVEEARARSLIGQLRKSKGDAEVVAALTECQNKAISDPVPWLRNRLKVARWVSASGYEYRGTPEQVLRDAERRADPVTYWLVKREIRKKFSG